LHRYSAEYDFRYNHRVALGYNDGERASLAVRTPLASASRIGASSAKFQSAYITLHALEEAACQTTFEGSAKSNLNRLGKSQRYCSV
jgi:hypothetical protein